MEQDIHTRLMQQLQGQEGIERTMNAAQSSYPRLFAQIEELVAPDSSNVQEINDYLLHVIEAYVRLKQSPLQLNPTCNQIFKVFAAVEQSYYLPAATSSASWSANFSPNLAAGSAHGVASASVAANTNATAAAAEAAAAVSARNFFALTLDTALMITLLAMMSGLKDLTAIASYSNYANQYLQLLLPAMMHPRYRISSVNCRTVMRLFNYDLLQGFFTNFFVRAKVATQLCPASLLGQVQPSLARLPQNGLKGLSYQDLSGFIPCLGLDHGLLLGPRPLLFLCADRLLLNGYDYLLSLNHLTANASQQLHVRLAQRSRSKFLIDKIDAYYDVLDEISEDMRSVVCIRRRNVQGIWEDFFFVSTLEPTTSSLYRLQADYGECEIALQQGTSYLMSVARRDEEKKDSYLPQQDDFNRFIVEILNHERNLIEQIQGAQALRPWEEVLYRNGSNPHYAVSCLCYYFLSDVLDPRVMAQQLQQQMQGSVVKPSLTSILRSANNPNAKQGTPLANESVPMGAGAAMGTMPMGAMGSMGGMGGMASNMTGSQTGSMNGMGSSMNGMGGLNGAGSGIGGMNSGLNAVPNMNNMPAMGGISAMSGMPPMAANMNPNLASNIVPNMPSPMATNMAQNMGTMSNTNLATGINMGAGFGGGVPNSTGRTSYQGASLFSTNNNNGAFTSAQLQAQAREQARVFAQHVPNDYVAPSASSQSAQGQGMAFNQNLNMSSAMGTNAAMNTAASNANVQVNASAYAGNNTATDYRMGPGMDMVYRPRRVYGSHAYARARQAYAQAQGLDDLPADSKQLNPYPQGSAAERLTQMNQESMANNANNANGGAAPNTMSARQIGRRRV